MTEINDDDDPLARLRAVGNSNTRRMLATSMIRQEGGIAFESAEDFEEYSRTLIRDAMEQARAMKRRGKRPEPEIFSANEQLAAVKYADEQGYVTKIEAQKIIRKLLGLGGKRGLANPAAQQKTTARAKRTPTTRRRTRP